MSGGPAYVAMAREGKAKSGKAPGNAKQNMEGKMGAKKGADSRFAAMHSDPRFKRFPKKAGKVEIDSRFAGMFTDEQFQVNCSHKKTFHVSLQHIFAGE